MGTPPEEIPMVLQAHSEGSSLRGMSPITGLAYETVISIIDAARPRGDPDAQMMPNQELKAVKTESTGADEFWGHRKKAETLS